MELGCGRAPWELGEKERPKTRGPSPIWSIWGRKGPTDRLASRLGGIPCWLWVLWTRRGPSCQKVTKMWLLFVL